MLNRRHFLAQSCLIPLSPLLPAFLARTASATDAKVDDRILVVIQLSGGNDGMNTVIPYASDEYPKFRKNLRVAEDEIIKLNDEIGLHPGLKSAADLFEDQRLAIVQGVGYPNPNRSHFRSMAIWHSARLDASQHTGQGWLGRAMDTSGNRSAGRPDAVFVGDGNIPAAIVGRRSNPISLNNEKELLLAAELSRTVATSAGSNLDSFLEGTVSTSFEAAKRFAEAAKQETADLTGYPNNNLGRKLKLMAKMIRMRTGTRIFYVSQPGYDTHAAQAGAHVRLLREFSNSLKAFLDDMKAAGFGKQVTVLAFSEFGRRVEENASAGTDHGTAGPVFVAGESVKPGLFSEYPSLTELDEEGDLISTVDFREIYTGMLQNWLNVDSVAAIGQEFSPMKLTV